MCFHLFVLFQVSCKSDQDKALIFFESAQRNFNLDSTKVALSEINSALLIDSANPEFLLLKARIFHELENFDQANSILQLVEGKRYKLDSVYCLIGDCYYGKAMNLSKSKITEGDLDNQYHEALNSYSKSLELSPYLYDAHIGKFIVLHDSERYEEALVSLMTSIRLFPDSVSLIAYRGVEKLYLEDFSSALDDFNVSIESKKLNSKVKAEVLRFRGILYYKKGEFQRSIDDLSKSIEYNPKGMYTYSNRADSFRALNMRENACKDYRKSAELGYTALYDEVREYCNQ